MIYRTKKPKKQRSASAAASASRDSSSFSHLIGGKQWRRWLRDAGMDETTGTAVIVGSVFLTMFVTVSLLLQTQYVWVGEENESNNLLLNSPDWKRFNNNRVAGSGRKNHHHPGRRSGDGGGGGGGASYSSSRHRGSSSSSSLSRKRIKEEQQRSIFGPLDDGGGADKQGEIDAMPSRRSLFERDNDPTDMARTFRAVEALRKPHPATHSEDLSYDIWDCPFGGPPAGYPHQWPLLRVLDDWGVDTTASVPETIYQGLCVFDWSKESDRRKAHAYRAAEVPFILQHHPEVSMAAERWNTPGYLEDLLGRNTRQRHEHSRNNHFMFWRLGKRGGPQQDAPEGWEAPTDEVKLTYPEWKIRAEKLERMTDAEQVNAEHWYLRLNGDYEGKNGYLYDELPIFEPTESTLFMVDPDDYRGINCRFGMRGVIAEAHYDSGRNWITVMGPGQRRYILAHPDQCRNMELYPMGHPSGRHSAVNWSDPPPRTGGRPFSRAKVNEVVMQAGDALYLPTSWFHFIVSLNKNYQCNARSGISTEYQHYIRQCGFK